MRTNMEGQKQTKAILSKKRSKKAQRGITLIALVITIVVLLILARRKHSNTYRRQWFINKSTGSKTSTRRCRKAR